MQLSATFHDLDKKSVFISGGGSGIGEFLTEGFIAQGANVAFVQRSDATGLCDRLETTYGRRPLYLQCDVTDIPAYRSALDSAATAHGPIQVLVNNAAWDNRHQLDEVDVDDWDYAINVNLRHHFFAIQSVAPAMRKARSGAIVNFSSISYMMGNAGYPVYVSAKAAITGMTRGLARELGGDGIRVNALMPGWVLTDRQKELWADEQSVKAHIDKQCLKEVIAPIDMVAPTLFLASESSRMMTGQALVVDAGVVVSG